MEKIKLKKVLNEINSVEPALIRHIIAGIIIKCCWGYFDVLFLSFLLDNYQKFDFKYLVLFIVLLLILNSLLYFFSKSNDNYLFSKRSLMHNLEKANVSNYVDSIRFDDLDNADFQNAFRQYESSVNSAGSSLFNFCEWLQNIITNILNIIISLFLVTTVFKYVSADNMHMLYALIFLLAAIAVMAVYSVFNKKFNLKKAKMNDEYLKTTSALDTCINGLMNKDALMEIQAYNAENFIKETAENALSENGLKIKRKSRSLTIKYYCLFGVLTAVVFILIILIIYMLTDGISVPSGSIVKCLTGIYKFFMSIMTLIMSIGQFKQIKMYLNYYFSLKAKNALQDKNSNKKLNKIESIEFRNVSFKYPKSEQYSLKDINFKLNEGEKLALVGQNGSGKTTLVNLLCGLYECTEGNIFINGIEINRFSKESLNHSIAVMFQDFFIMPGDIYESIAMSENFDLEKIYRISREVKLDENILTNDASDKKLEENNIKLSGGEQQKIALIRCLYKDSPVVVFDEPTSKFDPIAEYEFFTLFHSLTRDKTAVYISHRLSSCKFCERIIVLDRGRIIQEGTHAELLAEESGKYYEMWNAQAQFYSF